MRLFTKDPGRPSKNPSASGWLDENPLKYHKHSEKLPPYSDIVIIGSGFSGASTAYHLLVDERTRLDSQPSSAGEKQQPVKSVTMLEAREACGGATGRNGGHLIPANYRDFIDDSKATKDPEAVAATRIFEQLGAEEVARFIRENNVDCEFRFEGNLELYTTQADFDYALENVKVAKSWGLGGQRIFSRSELVDMFGNETTAVGGIMIPGGQVFPARFIWFLLYKAMSCGLQLYTHYPVVKVTQASPLEKSESLRHLRSIGAQAPSSTDVLWKVETENGESIITHKVVHGTNAYASHLLPSFRSHIFPVRAQVLSLAENVTSHKLWPFGLSLRHGAEYAIQRNFPHGRLILGGRRSSSPSLEVDTADDSVVNNNVACGLRTTVSYPEFSYLGNRPESYYNSREWTGIMGYSDDLHPFIGPVVQSNSEIVPGQYILAGFTGHGMPKCFRCGREIARLISSSYKSSSTSSQPNSADRAPIVTTKDILSLSSSLNPNPENVVPDSKWVWNLNDYSIPSSSGEQLANSSLLIDFPLVRTMVVTPERIRTIKTDSWHYRNLIPSSPYAKL
ncbi:hypothetical protein BB560_001056 [Smittium megazygosporum]|uniref:FAD dependent oxidoreductase domain-containing protein n=1 Tax=Smittium megazygosporum TaxID=133381 RepID=A0A2T9ZIW2_9FUNG|nr:hypothetical protein BB560_001056 [Smittium megazygosporum]